MPCDSSDPGISTGWYRKSVESKDAERPMVKFGACPGQAFGGKDAYAQIQDQRVEPMSAQRFGIRKAKEPASSARQAKTVRADT